MSKFIRLAALLFGALLGVTLLQVPAHASYTHTHCKGTAIKRCVTLNASATQIRATSKIDDRYRGAYQVATQNTRVQYYGWDRKWHNYSYVAQDYDGWKGNYDTAATSWYRISCNGARFRAVSVFKWKKGTRTSSETIVTSLHTAAC